MYYESNTTAWEVQYIENRTVNTHYNHFRKFINIIMRDGKKDVARSVIDQVKLVLMVVYIRLIRLFRYPYFWTKEKEICAIP